VIGIEVGDRTQQQGFAAPDGPFTAIHSPVAKLNDTDLRMCVRRSRQEVQPYRRRDNRKREPGQPRDKGGGKSGRVAISDSTAATEAASRAAVGSSSSILTSRTTRSLPF
jgi:hypothetical protein